MKEGDGQRERERELDREVRPSKAQWRVNSEGVSFGESEEETAG